MQKDDDSEDEMRIYGSHLFVGRNSGQIMMFDMSGRLVWQADAIENEWYELPQLLHGIYVIKTENATIKIVK